uniref:Putative secreted protein n=1 Tax=Anopheles darlingi TaxID=43151 RepID=A0A2M4DAP1_ANODA
MKRQRGLFWFLAAYYAAAMLKPFGFGVKFYPPFCHPSVGQSVLRKQTRTTRPFDCVRAHDRRIARPHGQDNRATFFI